MNILAKQVLAVQDSPLLEVHKQKYNQDVKTSILYGVSGK